MAKTIYLHIGTHKTGSTSIQRFLARADEALARQGILYPKTGRPTEGWSPYGQHKLQWAITEGGKAAEKRIWEDLRQEISAHPGRRVVISAEEFERCTWEEIQKVVDHFDRYSLRVILYLRPPVQFLRAAYAQRVKMGEDISFMQCVEEMLPRCNYLNLVSRWEQCEKVESVAIRLFDKVKEEPGLEASFAEVVGIDFDKVRSFVGLPANTSPPVNVVRVIRWINRLENIGPNVDIWHELVNRARKNVLGRRWPGRWLARVGPPFLRDSVVTEEARKKVRNRLKCDHSMFLEKHVEDKNEKYLQI